MFITAAVLFEIAQERRAGWRAPRFSTG